MPRGKKIRGVWFRETERFLLKTLYPYNVFIFVIIGSSRLKVKQGYAGMRFIPAKELTECKLEQHEMFFLDCWYGLTHRHCNFSFLLKSRAADWLSGSYTGKHDDGASRD